MRELMSERVLPRSTDGSKTAVGMRRSALNAAADFINDHSVSQDGLALVKGPLLSESGQKPFNI